MKLLSPGVHAWLDYALVVVLAVSPLVLDFGGVAATVVWVLAAAQAILSLVTDYPGGVARMMRFPVHGALELLVALALLASPWVFGFADADAPRNLYVATGIGLLVVWAVTDYRVRDPVMGRAPGGRVPTGPG